MEHLYERLEALLNTRPNDPLFAQFLIEINEQPLVQPGNRGITYLRFLNSGFSLNVNADGKIHRVLVLIDNEATSAGFYKPFPQALPWGIVPSDRCSDIESKLEIQPGVQKDIHFFRLTTHVLLCKFDAQSESIKSLLVWKLAAADEI